VEGGHPECADREPGLTNTARAQAPMIAAGFHRLGSFESLSFAHVDPSGWDAYDRRASPMAGRNFTSLRSPRGQMVYGVRPFAPRGRLVTNELIDKLREADVY
jgi:hypothetical protein